MNLFDLETYDYHLPLERIAQKPVEPRDASRLLTMERGTGRVEDDVFRRLPDMLDDRWLVVLNRTRVIPARLHGTKEETGAKIEILLLRKVKDMSYEALVRPAKRMAPGTRVSFPGTAVTALVEDVLPFAGGRLVSLLDCDDMEAFLSEIGEVPLPPYINRQPDIDDTERYQTVYARVPGSAAAPTAGLHFTEETLTRLQERGVETVEVLLHVGLGTFRPVEAGDIREHRIHSEYYEMPAASCDQLNQARREGKKILAVGTTVVRTLETACDDSGVFAPGSGDTRLFIYPGYTFRAVDGIITNFHLPKSSLLMLVCAFAGIDHTLEAYRHAVSEGYRFFSYGDAMLIR
jgi:S-adenosylmethionine:tRNA ribosyltransferase-isomerase